MRPGFHIDDFVNVLAFNVISRIIGFIIRFATILTAVIFYVVVCVAGILFFVIWIFLPLVTFPVYLFTRYKQTDETASIINKSRGNADALFSLCAKTQTGRFVEKRLHIVFPNFQTPSSITTDSILEEIKKWKSEGKIVVSDLLYAYTQVFKPFIDVLIQQNIKAEDVWEVAKWHEHIAQKEHEQKKFWTKENLSQGSSIGKNWLYGYTPTLNTFSSDLSYEALKLGELIGRDQEMEQLQRILIKEKGNSVFLVGDAGVGKRTLVVALTKLIQEGTCLKPLCDKRVVLLDILRLLHTEEAHAQETIIAVLKEAEDAGNIILVIPSFDSFVSSGEGRINLTDIFTQYIIGSNLQIIGFVDVGNYQKYILSNQVLLKNFEKVDILEVDKNVVIKILEQKVLDLEKKYKILVLYPSLKEIIKQSDAFVSDTPFPQKAIDLLIEAMVYAQVKKNTVVSISLIDELLSQKTKLPLGELQENEKEKLNNLENLLHEYVIDQETAITAIASALRRSRAGVRKQNSPIGTFLFLGPTGVGKTETAKALARVYFGSEDHMVRLDMEEFETENDIEKLIGKYDSHSVGILTSQIREKPFCVLLLDEFEKANPKILNLFLSIFDEAYVTDGEGKKVSFTNCIIIATSNAGSEFIREELEKGQSKELLEKSLTEYLLREKIFSPELINRFDSVTFFKPLGEKELQKIARLIIRNLSALLEEEKGIKINVSDDVLSKLIAKGYSPTFGARELTRVIQENIENVIAQKVLAGQAQKGSTIDISL